MRLSHDEQLSLLKATHICFGESAQIWVFGSRADDSKRGGDIDLYIETDLTVDIVKAKLAFRKSIWPTFGEQKIDLVVHQRHLEGARSAGDHERGDHTALGRARLADDGGPWV